MMFSITWPEWLNTDFTLLFVSTRVSLILWQSILLPHLGFICIFFRYFLCVSVSSFTTLPWHSIIVLYKPVTCMLDSISQFRTVTKWDCTQLWKCIWQHTPQCKYKQGHKDMSDKANWTVMETHPFTHFCTSAEILHLYCQLRGSQEELSTCHWGSLPLLLRLFFHSTNHICGFWKPPCLISKE